MKRWMSALLALALLAALLPTPVWAAEKASVAIEDEYKTYTKTRESADFPLQGITKSPDEAVLRYEVTDSRNAEGAAAANTSVITVNGAGTVHIVGAGSAEIRVSTVGTDALDAAEPQTIRVTVKADYTPEALSASARCGESGEVSLFDLVKTGGTLGEPHYAQVYEAVPDTLSADNANKKLSFKFKDDATQVGQTALVTVPVTGAANYEDYEITVRLTVGKKAVTVTADDKSKEYGADDPEFTATLSGGAALALASCAFDRQEGSAPGSYSITPKDAVVKQGGAVVTDKCDIAYAAGTLTINKADPRPTVSVEGWRYGAYNTLTNKPNVERNFGNGAETYYYGKENKNEGGTAWPANPNSLDAGDYYLYATVAETANYKAATTDAVPFTVSKTTHEPASVAMSKSIEQGGSAELNLTRYLEGGRLGTVSVYSTDADAVAAAVTNGGTGLQIAVTRGTAAGTKGTVTARAVDATNYEPYDIVVTVTVTARTVTPTITVEGGPFTYTGSEIKPEITVKDGENRIDDPNEYNVSYNNNVNAGTATVTVTNRAGGNYTIGEASETFTIGRAALTPTVRIRDWTYGAYKPAQNAPGVEGNLGGGAVKYYYGNEDKNRDGTAWPADPNSLDAGDYYLYATVSESTNYAAATTEAVKFTVGRAKPAYTPDVLEIERGKSDRLDLTDFIHSDTATAQSVYGFNADTRLVDKKLTVETTDATKAGEYAVTISVKNAENYEDYSFDVTVRVTPKIVREPTIRLEYNSHVYTGAALEPKVLAVLDGENLIDPSEYSVSYTKNTGAGSAKVSIVDARGGDYDVSGSTTFEILHEKASCVAPAARENLVYNGSPQTLITAGTPTGGTMQYRIGEGSEWSAALPSEIDAGAYTVYYKVSHDLNHTDSDQESVLAVIGKTTRSDVELSKTLEPGKSVSIPLTEYIAPDGTLGTPQVYSTAADTQTVQIVDGRTLRITASDSAPVGSETTVTVPVENAKNYKTYYIVVSATISPVSYAVTVEHGTGSGSYAPGESVKITAEGAPRGQTFEKWTTKTEGVSFADEAASTTTFTMPARAVTVTANYKGVQGTVYDVTVEHGSTKDSPAAAGATVTITADAAPEGQVFEKWTTETEGVSFADAAAPTTTFAMPARAVTVTASYKASLGTLTGTVTISGTAKVGYTLTANVANCNNTGTLSYQWKADGAAITGATASTLALTAAQQGKAIVCEVTSSTHSGSLLSAPTGLVAAASSSGGGSSSGSISVSLNYSRLELYVDDYGYLVATVLPTTVSQDVTWSSSNSKVVSVDSSGNFNANRKGTAYITATSRVGGHEASCYVRVSEWDGGSSNYSRPQSGSQNNQKKETTTIIVPTPTTSQSVDYKDGSRATVTNRLDGTSTIIKTDKNGILASASVTYSDAAVQTASQGSGSLLLPTEVYPAQNLNAAPELSIVLPNSSQSVRVKIPLAPASQGAVAVVENLFGPDEIIKASSVQNGDLTFKLKGSAVIRVIDNSKSFYDVDGSQWYGESIAWAASREIMNGVSEHMFDPNGTMNRAMMTQIMYNYANAASTDVTGAFSDVNADSWYGKSVTWAADNGIAHVSGDSFGAENALTREDMATMLYNYAKSRGYSTYTNAKTSTFSDSAQISEWARDAMTWAVGAGLIKGTQNGTRTVVLDPQGTATRAQLATIMQRFSEKVES